jgi:hypothetical protein
MYLLGDILFIFIIKIRNCLVHSVGICQTTLEIDFYVAGYTSSFLDEIKLPEDHIDHHGNCLEIYLLFPFGAHNLYAMRSFEKT